MRLETMNRGDSGKLAAMGLLCSLALIVAFAQSAPSALAIGAPRASHASGASLHVNRCHRAVRGAHIVRADRTAVVYSRHPYAAPSQSDLDASVCLLASGRTWHLDGDGVDSLLEDFRLQRRYFVWTNQTLAGPASAPGLGAIYLVDVVSRKRLVSAGVVGPYPNGPYLGPTSLPSVAIGPHGELVWIGSADAWYPPPTASSRVLHYEVWVSYRGKNTKLDVGPDIAPHSLRLSADGSTVTWSSGGQTKTAHIT